MRSERAEATLPSAARLRAPARYWSGAPWLVLLLVSVVAVRVHELIPALAPLRPAILTALVSSGLLLLHSGERLMDILAGDQMFRLMLAYFAWAVVTAPFALWPGHAASAYGIFIPTLMMVGAFAFCAPTFRNVDRVQAAIVGAAGALAFQLLAQGRMNGGRLTSIGAFDSNDIAALLAFIFPLALGLAIRTRGPVQLIGIVTAPAALATIAATASRGGMIALVVASAVYAAGLRGTRRTVFIAFLVLGGITLAMAAPPQFRERMATLGSLGEDYNLSEHDGRMAVWRRGLGYLWTDPVMGVGFDNFYFAEGRSLAAAGRTGKWSAAHNAYLQVFVDLGIVGGVVYMTMLIGAVRRAIRQTGSTLRESCRRPELLAAIVAFCTSALFLSHAYSWPLFGLLGLIYFADRARIANTGEPEPLKSSATTRPTEWRSRRALEPGVSR